MHVRSRARSALPAEPRRSRDARGDRRWRPPAPAAALVATAVALAVPLAAPSVPAAQALPLCHVPGQPDPPACHPKPQPLPPIPPIPSFESSVPVTCPWISEHLKFGKYHGSDHGTDLGYIPVHTSGGAPPRKAGTPTTVDIEVAAGAFAARFVDMAVSFDLAVEGATVDRVEVAYAGSFVDGAVTAQVVQGVGGRPVIRLNTNPVANDHQFVRLPILRVTLRGTGAPGAPIRIVPDDADNPEHAFGWFLGTTYFHKFDSDVWETTDDVRCAAGPTAAPILTIPNGHA